MTLGIKDSSPRRPTRLWPRRWKEVVQMARRQLETSHRHTAAAPSNRVWITHLGGERSALLPTKRSGCCEPP